MALSRDPEKVLSEVLSQARARDDVLEGAQRLIDDYPGSWYSHKGEIGERTLDTKNAAFEHLSSEMSQLVWSNPRWRVSTRRPRAQELVAEAMHWGMDSWTRDSDLKTTLEDLAVDYEFAWFVGHVTAQPVPESYEPEDPILFPQVSRLSQWDFGQDHLAPTTRRARMQWHRYRIDKEDALERALEDRNKPRDKREGWDVSAIRGLSETSIADSWLRNSRRGEVMGSMEGAGYDTPDRKQIEVVEVYFPGMLLPGKPGPDDGFNGVIATYGVPSGQDATGAVEIRKPRPFFGPRWGPYVVCGCYIVPNRPWPLSHLVACAPANEAARLTTAAVNAQVRAYKRLGITNDAQLANLIQSKPNETIHTYQHHNLDQAFREFETGGTTRDNVLAEQRAQMQSDRMMGFSENQRGITTGDTAREVEYANLGVQAKQGYRRARYQDGVRRIGKTVAWYLYHTDEIVMPLGEEAINALKLEPEEEAWFVGGRHDAGSGMTFDDLGLEIEPLSMERPSEQLLMRHGELLTNIASLAPTFPMLAQVGADVKGFIDAYGESYGYNKLSRLFPGIESVDWSEMQASEVEPRLVRDVGLRGLQKAFGGGGAGGGGGRAPGGGGGPRPTQSAPSSPSFGGGGKPKSQGAPGGGGGERKARVGA